MNCILISIKSTFCWLLHVCTWCEIEFLLMFVCLFACFVPAETCITVMGGVHSCISEETAHYSVLSSCKSHLCGSSLGLLELTFQIIIFCWWLLEIPAIFPLNSAVWMIIVDPENKKVLFLRRSEQTCYIWQQITFASEHMFGELTYYLVLCCKSELHFHNLGLK